ncbi:HlyIII-domain-containing protein [Trematosphaeria pertusa]|uniref:HlyIII-domain-containing protein n=1 Tax=Trematosphaeria pertusa TaxID=390896 RepID=A0A6A6HY67_9PLEO|nr:HlyIII-domain-containing protein [Trematosphaeria pertusa]KAF2243164.1 HlyIII-domain-containing protein [Trematosphaeria pertusa]
MRTKNSNTHGKSSDIRRILLFDDIPSWMQVDPHIRRGYRDELRSVRNCVYSLFYTHNEFVNVWSHLLPAIVHLVLLAREERLALGDDLLGMSWSRVVMVQLYMVSAVLCLLSSSAYHVLKAHSERVAQSVLKLDYLGIVLNIAIISITSTWSGLRQQPHLQASYITSSVGLSGIVFFVLLSPKADGAAAALWRAMLFAAFVGSGYVPIVHSYLSHGLVGLRYFPVTAALIMNALDFLGAIFYVTRFPERHFPETFDIWGSSHQIFHVLVMLGQIVYLRGLRSVVAQI